MRMTPENKHKARAALVDAAGKLFREQGVAATGIDAIARETGQTSGAFYAHFPSKADVFRDAVEAGFARLIGGIKRTGEGGRGARWAGQFAQAYLSPARRDAVGQGCLLPTLANDAARSTRETHRLFGEMLSEAARRAREGLRRSSDGARRGSRLRHPGPVRRRVDARARRRGRSDLGQDAQGLSRGREGLGWKRSESNLIRHCGRRVTHLGRVTQPLRSPSSRRRPDRSPRHIPCAGARRTLPPTGCP